MNKVNYPKIKEIMTKKHHVLNKDTPILEAIDIFDKHQITSAPVVNDQKCILGFVTEYDCIKSLGNYLFFDELKNVKVKDFMTKKVFVIEENKDVYEVENLFEKHHIHFAPVVNKDGRYVGIISQTNLLHAYKRIFDQRLKYKAQIKKVVEMNTQERLKMFLRTI